uniref:Uncharacterized protein n=1 Tax=Tanacetum cinerariifolium TaxID=118510 RepID=A0A6L2JBX0_TANCI|nr:hypothetical protein [Tanacetum cinerariifolium]
MHQFWSTIKKIGKTNGYKFKLDKKKCRVDTEVFCEILQICLRLHNQDFLELPSEEDLLTFIITLASVTCYLPFELIKCTSLGGRLLLSLTSVSLGKQQELTGSGNHELRSCTLKFISKIEDYQKYGALIPDGMINQDIKDSKSYKTYLDYATGEVPPKKVRKFKKPASPKLKIIPASPKEPTQKGKQVKRAAKKATTTPNNRCCHQRYSWKSKQETYKLQASGLSEGAGFKSEVPDEQTDKTEDTSKGTGVKPGVPNVSKEDSSDSDNDSWGDSEDKSDDVHNEDDNDEDDDNDDDNGNDDDGSSDAEDRFVQEEDAHVKLTTVHDKIEGPLQSSSISSDITSKLLNLDDPSLNINSMMNTSTVPPPPPPVNPFSHLTTIPQQQTPDSTRTTTYPIMTWPKIPNFSSLFQYDQKDKEEVNVAVWLQSNKIKEEAKSENQEFINQVDSTMKAIIKEQHKSSGKSTKTDELEFKVVNTKMHQDQGNESGHIDDQPDNKAAPKHDCKPLSSIEDRGRQVVPVDYFINNDLEYMKDGSSSSKYKTSTTRTKDAKYENTKGIKDAVPTLWSPFEEMIMCSTTRLNLRDINDMLLLLVQKKLSNLDVDDRYDLGVVLRMFTRRIIILHLVKDLQLGVKSYQKKHNITRLETFRSDIPNMILYTAYKNPQRIIYQDKFQKYRLMRLDELYKFCNGTLSSVRTVLHDIASSLEIDYLPQRHWSNLEKKRSRIMIKAIDKFLFERRLMRNLEKFVGGSIRE